jgi:glycosyltransferase involved in cell wall biosynthesis
MPPDLSVVIPIYNESPNIRQLHAELTATLEAWGRPYEIVAVDDGSRDDSFQILAELHAADPRLHVIRFRRNFGQTAAFAAGFAQARGAIIVASDIVCGWRRDRKDTWLTRRVPSILANRLISAATGVRLHDYGCSLKAFRAEVVKPLRLYGEMHRFIPAIASEIGVRITEQEVNHRPRLHGTSKYGLSRTIRVVLDLLTVKYLLDYSKRPLQIFGLVGLMFGGLGALMLLWLIGVKFIGHQGIGDRPLLMFGILLVFTGVQLVTIGLLAEMQARTYHESQNKATYVIRDVLS